MELGNLAVALRVLLLAADRQRLQLVVWRRQLGLRVLLLAANRQRLVMQQLVVWWRLLVLRLAEMLVEVEVDVIEMGL